MALSTTTNAPFAWASFTTWAKSITSSNTYNKLYSYLGSSENAEFAKLSKAKKIIFFEGNDRKILRKFLIKAGLDDVVSDPNILLLKTDQFVSGYLYHRLRYSGQSRYL